MPSIDLLPSANGFYREWNGGGDFTRVNDASDATFDATAGGGKQSYEVDDLPADATQVVSVTIKARLSASTADWNGLISGLLRHNDDLTPNAFTYHPTTSVVEQSALVARPGGGDWTPAEVNALQPVLWGTADDGFNYHAPNEGRCARVWLTVVYNTVPPAPTNLTAVVTTPTQVDLAWTDNATNETGFKVERADGPGGDFVQIATPGVNAVTYSDTTAKPNNLYSYRVRATNGSGDSEYTNIAVVSVGVVAPDQASFSKDNATARFEVLQHVRNLGYKAGELVGLVAIKFDVGAGEIGPVNFNMAAYDNATALAAAIQTAIRTAIGGGDTTGLCTFSNSTHKFTVGRSSGTFSLLIDTGDDQFKDMSIWPHLGFNRGVDKTGASSYVADNAVFESADKDHILLASFNGYKDDGSGTYTGTASSRIDIAPDVARCLIERWGPLAVSRFNLASFVDGRLHGPSMVRLFVWIAQRESLEEVLAKIENGALAHVVMDSEGVVHYVPYSDQTIRREFFDRDFLSFKVRRVKGNVYKGVRLHYGVHPHTGRYDAVESVVVSAEVLHDRKELLDVWTYIRDKDTAEAAAAMHATLVTSAKLEVEFESRSKLVDLKLADVIAITRARCALSPTGALDAMRFKVTELRHNKGTGVSYCYAVEQIDLG